MSEVIIRPLDIAKDAQGLADMWNASNLQWPGNFTGGIPATASEICEWAQEENPAEVWIAQVGDEIAGYCSLMEGCHGRMNEGYVDLLNVHPKYQGRSIGRRLLQASIAHSVGKKWHKQTLGTWSANFKAVPTYKKTGHFWRPDSAVDMENFIPGALQLSLAQAFFSRHDWYTTYVRALEQVEDEQLWEGVKVYTETWRADGESLTIWIDREARAPLAVETDQLLVAAIPAQVEPFVGAKVTLRWRVSNKSQEPLQVVLHALGDKGLEIDHRDLWIVPAGETVERTAAVSVADDALHAKDDGSAPAVRSILRLGDQEVELFSGIRARKRWSLDTHPGQVTLRSGRPTTIQLQLHSEEEQAIPFALQLLPPEGLKVDWQRKRGKLAAKGHLSIPLTLTAMEEGIYALPLRAISAGEGAPGPLDETITVFSLSAGGMLAQQSGDAIRIETDTLRISVVAKDAAVSVQHKAHDIKLIGWRPIMGPPYWPSSLADQTHAMRMTWVHGRLRIDMHCEDKKAKGLYLYQRLIVSSDGTLDISRWMENRSECAHERVLRLSVGSSSREIERLSLPLLTGIVQSVGTGYPTGTDDVPRDPAAYAEPWMAWERKGAVAGITWGPLCASIRKMWGVSLDSRPLDVAPGERSRVVRCAVSAGDGDWRTVRRLAARWEGAAIDNSLQLRGPLQARLSAPVLATVGESVETTLIIDSAMKRRAHGTVELLSDNLLSDKSQVSFALDRDTPRCEPLRIEVPEAPGVYSGQVQLEAPLWQSCWPYQVVRLGDDRRVRITLAEQEGLSVWTIDNGHSVWQLCSQFGPSIISWRIDDREQLWSSFPKAAGFSWHYPFFGGLHTSLLPTGTDLWEGVLHREKLQARIVRDADADGVAWHGVRLECDLQKKALRGLRVELEYLTVGGSPVLKHVVRFRNQRHSRHSVRMHLSLAYSLGADPKSLCSHTPFGARQATELDGVFGELGWAALCDPASGRSGLIVGSQPDVSLWDGGIAGSVLGAGQEIKLDCDKTHELVYYMVVTDDLASAKEYIALGQLNP